MKASITDWIQALAVTIGVAFATWEFVLKDRAQEHLKKEAVLQLIVSGQNQSISTSAQNIQQKFSELQANPDASLQEWGQLQTIYMPIQAYLSAWGFCYHNEMCDRELTEAYICNSLTDFDKFRVVVNQKVNRPDFNREEGYAALLKVCQKQVH